MKTTTLLLLLTLALSCSPSNKDEVVIHSLATDFPTSTSVELKLLRSFDIPLNKYNFTVNNSLLWFTGGSSEVAAACYDMNTGEKVSTIMYKGRSKQEIISEINNLQITNDSVYIESYCFRDGVRAFSKRDILEDKEINEREMKVHPYPTVFGTKTPKKNITFDNGSKLVINNYFFDSLYNMQKRYVICDNSGETYIDAGYKNIEEKNLSELSKYRGSSQYMNVTEGADKEMLMRAFISRYLYYGTIISSHNNKAIVANSNGLVLEVIDTDKKALTNERYYSKMLHSPDYSKYLSSEPLQTHTIKSTDKYIYCFVSHHNYNDAIKRVEISYAVYQFDWKLKPIKKFELPKSLNTIWTSALPQDLARCWHNFSDDGKKLYFIKDTGDKQDFYEVKLDA